MSRVLIAAMLWIFTCESVSAGAGTEWDERESTQPLLRKKIFTLKDFVDSDPEQQKLANRYPAEPAVGQLISICSFGGHCDVGIYQGSERHSCEGFIYNILPLENRKFSIHRKQIYSPGLLIYGTWVEKLQNLEPGQRIIEAGKNGYAMLLFSDDAIVIRQGPGFNPDYKVRRRNQLEATLK